MNAEPYNFRKPGRLAIDLEHRLAGWLRDACTLAPEKWGRYLPFRVEMSLKGIDTALPADGLARLPEAGVGYQVSLNSSCDNTLIVLPRPIALALVGGMLGDATPELPADRDVTPVEESLIEYLGQQLLAAVIQETWPGLDKLAMRVCRQEPHPRWTRIFPREEKVVVCTFALSEPFAGQEWHWLVPQPALLEQFTRSDQVTDPTVEQAARARLQGLVRELPVSVSVTLGQVKLPLAQVARLRTGDLLILEQRVTEPLTATVAGEEKFLVWPGRVGSRQASQIESVRAEA